MESTSFNTVAGVTSNDAYRHTQNYGNDNNNEDDTSNTSTVKYSRKRKIDQVPDLPLPLILSRILPFLGDRVSWNNASMMCKEARTFCFNKSNHQRREEQIINTSSSSSSSSSPSTIKLLPSLHPPPWPNSTTLFRIIHEDDNLSDFSFSCDGNLLAANNCGTIHFFDRWIGKIGFSLSIPSNQVSYISFSPTNPLLLAIGIRHKPIILCDLSKGILQHDNKLTARGGGRGGNLTDLNGTHNTGYFTWSFDGKIIATSCFDWKIRFYQASNRQLFHVMSMNESLFQQNGGIIGGITFSPTNYTLAVSLYESCYLVWDLQVQQHQQNESNNKKVASLDLSTETSTTTLTSISLSLLSPHPIQLGTTNENSKIIFSPCGNYLLGMDSSNQFCLWKIMNNNDDATNDSNNMGTTTTNNNNDNNDTIKVELVGQFPYHDGIESYDDIVFHPKDSKKFLAVNEGSVHIYTIVENNTTSTGGGGGGGKYLKFNSTHVERNARTIMDPVHFSPDGQVITFIEWEDSYVVRLLDFESLDGGNNDASTSKRRSTINDDDDDDDDDSDDDGTNNDYYQ